MAPSALIRSSCHFAAGFQLVLGTLPEERLVCRGLWPRHLLQVTPYSSLRFQPFFTSVVLTACACRRSAVMGHTSAFSVAYFTQVRFLCQFL